MSNHTADEPDEPVHSQERTPLLDPSSVTAPSYSQLEGAAPSESRHRSTFNRYILLILLALGIATFFIVGASLLLPIIAQHLIDNGALDIVLQKAELRDILKSLEHNDGKTTETDFGMHTVGNLLFSSKLLHLTKFTTWILGSSYAVPSNLTLYTLPDFSSMAEVSVPRLLVDLAHNASKFEFSTPFYVQNQTAMEDFCRNTIQEEIIRWHVKGSIGIRAGWWPWIIHLRLDQSMKLQGMGGLKQVQVNDIYFPGAHPRGGVEIKVMASIYNPSNALSLTLDDLNFAIYLPSLNGTGQSDILIALVHAPVLKLLGNQENLLNLSGRTLFFNNNIPQDHRDVIDTFLSKYLRGESSLVHIKGSSVGPDVATSTSIPPWLQSTLESVTLSALFPGAPPSKLIEEMQFADLKIDFTKNIDPVISTTLLATLRLPLTMQFELDVTKIHPLVFIYLNETSPQPFGRIIVRSTPAITHSQDPVLIEAKIKDAPFMVEEGREDEFVKFLGDVFYGNSTAVYFKGSTNATARTPMGLLNVHDLPFNGSIYIQGMRGLEHPSPKVCNITITNGTASGLSMSTTLNAFNPSNVSISMGTARFWLFYDSVRIGSVSIDSFWLDIGRNDMVVDGILDHLGSNEDEDYDPEKSKKAIETGLKFISRYISGDTTPLTISGLHPEVIKSPLLAPLLHEFEMVTIPPIFNESLLINVTMNLLSSTIILVLHNPLPVTPITLLTLNATATYKEHIIGTVAIDFVEYFGEPIFLPPARLLPYLVDLGEVHVNDGEDDLGEGDGVPGPVVKTRRIPFHYVPGAGYEAVRAALGGEIEVNITSEVSLLVGEMKLSPVDYVRNNVKSKVKKGI